MVFVGAEFGVEKRLRSVIVQCYILQYRVYHQLSIQVRREYGKQFSVQYIRVCIIRNSNQCAKKYESVAYTVLQSIVHCIF